MYSSSTVIHGLSFFGSSCSEVEEQSKQAVYAGWVYINMLPQRPGKIGIAVCVLVCLGLFALLRFPKDEKSSEGGFPSKNTRGIYEPGMTEPPPKGGMVQEGMVQGGMVQGGMVQLKEITPVPVNHDGSGAMKKVCDDPWHFRYQRIPVYR